MTGGETDFLEETTELIETGFEYVTVSNDVILFRFRGRNRRVKIKI
jgi:hypothetical protein